MLSQNSLLDWSGGHGSRLTHDLFKFPGKFHPPLVESILRATKPKGVIDPMAGVGTVAVEAKVAGIPSLHFDVDPLSIFFGRVKTTALDPEELQTAWGDLSANLRPYERPRKEILLRRFQDLNVSRFREALVEMEASDLQDHSYWFRRYALADYARIDHSIHNGALPGRGTHVRRFFWACLLSSVRRISLADPTPVSGLEITKHMKQRLKRGYEIDVFAEFSRRVDLGIGRMKEFVAKTEANGSERTACTFVQDDCLNLQKHVEKRDFNGNLILFSPPYCNAIEYWRRHRLEYLLGRFLNQETLEGFSKNFIGRLAVGHTPQETPEVKHQAVDKVLAHLVSLKRQRKAWQLWHYFEDMRTRLETFYAALPRSGRCIVVVGDSTTSGQAIPTAAALAAFGKRAGFKLNAQAVYPIRNRVMQYPVKAGESKIHAETMLVLRKG